MQKGHGLCLVWLKGKTASLLLLYAAVLAQACDPLHLGMHWGRAELAYLLCMHHCLDSASGQGRH